MASGRVEEGFNNVLAIPEEEEQQKQKPTQCNHRCSHHVVHGCASLSASEFHRGHEEDEKQILRMYGDYKVNSEGAVMITDEEQVSNTRT